MENGIPARRRLHNGFEVYEATNLELLCGDFFALTRTTIQEVAAVYDRAALISWTPELRAPYVRHLTGLLKPGTPILLHALEYPQAQMPGPPFSLERGEIERLYAPYCNIREIDRQDILATETRLRARGVTELCEVCYLMVRTMTEFAHLGALSGARPGRLRGRHRLPGGGAHDRSALRCAGPIRALFGGIEDIARCLARDLPARQTGR